VVAGGWDKIISDNLDTEREREREREKSLPSCHTSLSSHHHHGNVSHLAN